jgi:hypothetical protein
MDVELSHMNQERNQREIILNTMLNYFNAIPHTVTKHLMYKTNECTSNIHKNKFLSLLLHVLAEKLPEDGGVPPKHVTTILNGIHSVVL